MVTTSLDPRRIAVAFCAICAFLHLYSPQSVLPFMAQEFGAGAAEASMVLTAGTLAVALTAPFTGAVSDYLGRKRMIVTAMIALLFPTVMVAFSESLTELIVWRFVQGLLLPPIFAVTIAYIGDEWPPAEATAVVGIYASASALGGFLSRLVPGVLSDWVTWRGGFLALALLNVLCLVIVAVLLPRETKFVKAASILASTRQMLNHLRNPRLLATYAVGFGVLFNFIATFTFITFHLAAPPFNRSAFFLGTIFVVYLVGSGFALWSGKFIAAVGRRTFVLCVLGVWVGGMLLTLLPSLPAIVLGLIVASTCGILTQASSTGFVAITAKGGTSSAVGLYVTSFYVGGTFGGWLPGLAYEWAGWPGSLVLVLIMIAIMAGIVALFWREPKATAA
jgi:MFS transporter, YNFM family, putative membrane transport protein